MITDLAPYPWRTEQIDGPTSGGSVSVPILRRRSLKGASVPILTKDSHGRSGVRLWWHEEDFGMHLAVSCGSGDGGRLDFGTKYAAEAGLAEPDRVAVG